MVAVRGFTFDHRKWGRCDSYGMFWPRRAYNCYYVVPRDATQPTSARFDVLRDTRVTADEIAYMDLYLDLWVVGDNLEWQDEDELAEAVTAGKITARDLAIVERARSVLTRGHTRVVAEVRRTLLDAGAPIR